MSRQAKWQPVLRELCRKGDTCKTCFCVKKPWHVPFLVNESCIQELVKSAKFRAAWARHMMEALMEEEWEPTRALLPINEAASLQPQARKYVGCELCYRNTDCNCKYLDSALGMRFPELAIVLPTRCFAALSKSRKFQNEFTKSLLPYMDEEARKRGEKRWQS